MTIDELIEQLKALPKDVRRHPLMDGKAAVGYRLAPFVRITVDKVLVMADGSVQMADPELSDEENIDDMSEYDQPVHIERRALAFID